MSGHRLSCRQLEHVHETQADVLGRLSKLILAYKRCYLNGTRGAREEGEQCSLVSKLIRGSNEEVVYLLAFRKQL